MSPGQYRAWLSGMLEGLAGRVVEDSFVDRLIERIEMNRPRRSDDESYGYAQSGEKSSPKQFLDDYDGPGGEPGEPLGDDGQPLQGQMTTEDLRAMKAPKGQKPKRMAKAERPNIALPSGRPKPQLENTTPVGTPQAAPDEFSTPGVVRLG